MSFFVDDSPIAREEWQLEPRVTASSVAWFVSKLHGVFSSSHLAEKIVGRLVECNEDYTRAYR